MVSPLLTDGSGEDDDESALETTRLCREVKDDMTWPTFNKWEGEV